VKVLCVIDSLGSGGAQRQIANLAVGLQDRRHDVSVFTYHPEAFFEPLLATAGVRIFRARKARRWSLAPAARLRELLCREKFDAVISFLDTPNVYAEIASIGTRLPRLIVSERSSLDRRSMSVARRLKLELHRLATHVTTNSHHLRESLQVVCPWLVPRLRTIWNGVDLERFRPVHGAAPAGNGLKLLVVSSVAPFKNGHRVIEALKLLQARGIRAAVTWVGAHQLTIASRRRASLEWKEQLRTLQLESQWTWVEPTDAIPQLMHTHDALLHPSCLEGLPNAICEALASGLPVLASAGFDHERLVGTSGAGILFDPSSPTRIADAIHRFSVLAPPARCEMAARARAFAERHLSIDEFVAGYEETLR
jgi:glycosyltransferase involved in cell wall biosynthesis